MNCPHCNKRIFGITGIQELQKFYDHLRWCPKITKQNDNFYANKSNQLKRDH